MTKIKIEPDKIFVNFLRQNLTDINSSRTTNWIYPDFPRIQDLGNGSFPRIGVTILSENASWLGVYDDNTRHTVALQIDVITKKEQNYTLTVTDESSGSVSSTINSNRLSFEFIPNTVTNIKHDGSAYSTVTSVAANENFSTPSTMGSGTVEYARSTGELNLNSADVSSHDGQDLTVSYTVNLEGKKACQHLARQIWKKIRTLWRTDLTPRGLYYPNLIANEPVPLDEELGIYRQMIEIEVQQYNIGEGL